MSLSIQLLRNLKPASRFAVMKGARLGFGPMRKACSAHTAALFRCAVLCSLCCAMAGHDVAAKDALIATTSSPYGALTIPDTLRDAQEKDRLLLPDPDLDGRPSDFGRSPWRVPQEFSREKTPSSVPKPAQQRLMRRFARSQAKKRAARLIYRTAKASVTLRRPTQRTKQAATTIPNDDQRAVAMPSILLPLGGRTSFEARIGGSPHF